MADWLVFTLGMLSGVAVGMSMLNMIVRRPAVRSEIGLQDVSVDRLRALYVYLDDPEVLLKLPQPYRMRISELLHGSDGAAGSAEDVDLPGKLRRRAEWLESRSFATLDGSLEREAADEIERLRDRPTWDCVVRGWPWLGVGRLRMAVLPGSWYSLFMVFLTTKLAFGVHVGGRKGGVWWRVIRFSF